MLTCVRNADDVTAFGRYESESRVAESSDSESGFDTPASGDDDDDDDGHDGGDLDHRRQYRHRQGQSHLRTPISAAAVSGAGVALASSPREQRIEFDVDDPTVVKQGSLRRKAGIRGYSRYWAVLDNMDTRAPSLTLYSRKHKGYARDSFKHRHGTTFPLAGCDVLGDTQEHHGQHQPSFGNEAAAASKSAAVTSVGSQGGGGGGAAAATAALPEAQASPSTLRKMLVKLGSGKVLQFKADSAEERKGWVAALVSATAYSSSASAKCRSDAESAAAPGMDGVGSGVSIAISNYMPPTGGAGAAADKLSPLASPKTSPKVSRKGSKSPKAMKKGRKPKDAARASPSPLRKGATVKTTSN